MKKKYDESVEDLSKPTEWDLLEQKPEMKSLTIDAEGTIAPVWDVVADKDKKADAVTDVPAGVLGDAVKLVDCLAERCAAGWTPSLEDVRKLRSEIAALK